MKPTLKIINLNQIDVDKYMPIVAKHGKRVSKGGAPASKAKKASAIDYTPLRTLQMDGKISIGKLILKKILLKNILVKLIAKGGVIQVNPMSLALYKGKMNLYANLDVRKAHPITKISLNINHVLIGEMIKDMLKKECSSLAQTAILRAMGC